MLNTIDRTGKVLDLFTGVTPEWGVTELSTALGLPKSTTFDIVASLAEIGLLQQTSDARYRLGWRVLQISRHLMKASCFGPRVHRTVAELAAQLGAAVTIGVWAGQDVVCIANACANRPDRVLAEGTHIAGHTSALGKLLMAQLPWPKVQERIGRTGVPAMTGNSIFDIDVLHAQLIAARRHDIATDDEDTIAGLSCVAVGIYQREGHAIAALSICTQSERMRVRSGEYARIARRAASTVLQQDVTSQIRTIT